MFVLKCFHEYATLYGEHFQTYTCKKINEKSKFFYIFIKVNYLPLVTVNYLPVTVYTDA